MQIGITLPAMVPRASGDLVLEWARRADCGPFSSLTMGERIAYPSYDLMTTLAAAAAVTQRIRLVANIVVLPLHSAALVAKQAATIDALSGGRLTLGLGIGGREEDFHAAGAPFPVRRYRVLEQQITLMRRIWCGETPAPGINPIGPAPIQAGGPPLMAGALVAGAIRRSARWADGLLAWTFAPDLDIVRMSFEAMRAGWVAAGRRGTPWLAVACYFALGRDAAAGLQAYVRHYLAFVGEEFAAARARSVTTTTAEGIRTAMRQLADLGADELILVPTIAAIDQIEEAMEIAARPL
jgi:alkanesulfonate monooxygenase SsuD/methylene tetrahydromethanopterin reductase-like flavin-dependent oxidoreductase (luciferase family)